MYSQIIPLSWCLHIVLCFYLIRPIRIILYRALLTLIPCFILIFIGCHNLPYLHMSSILTISLYWMITIRLIHLIIFSPDETNSFRIYALKFLWFFLPIIPCQSKNSISFYLILASIKILLIHWIFQWLRICEPNDSYGRLAMFYIYICTGTFLNDIQIVLVRLITLNKYSLVEFNNYPFLSKSIREFWGRRYNRLVGILLKEAIFDPIRRLPYSSAIVGALASFIMSGILHVHVAVAGFGTSSPLSPFLFFLLQGIACCIEVMCPFTPPKLLGILLTHGFLLITAPLYVGLFTRAGPEFYEFNKPLLFDATWFPKLPVPNFCPK
ncbi:unnamed protein product [Rotaria sordida]|uniref:Wax synthase domain-containing protein n=1 Tax=Rotaria sordida TaxID=392033 RepID=A0A819R5M5_9BILA|nr:unnamed protein product [Rotaria sordida]CAF4036902.1 unnamed protein product [Rotaria sordida]